ncbi:uncharacterized protein LOC117344237 [Pecten maximus]|uniref:uncharacterized protein LOC117344237 n=1 Tax=Pecten maximus TaxID=6579 RepID=UPI0014588D42|nr:uncharacterized protein LOC117344237 [Pecten maximus]
MRDMITEQTDWDEPLDIKYKEGWVKWCQSLKDLEDLSISRTYLPISLSSTSEQEVHIFSDASEKAICAVAYMKATDINGDTHVGFIIGKSKVSPKHGHTIPRLELCAAVIAVELSETVSEHLCFPVEQMKFYTDSKVVLGYINNRVRRFYVYVENRVNRILRTTLPKQWSYVSTNDNPADLGTRPVSSHLLDCSDWIRGPECIHTCELTSDETFQLQYPEKDSEIRPEDEVHCLKLSVRRHHEYDLGTKRFEKFSHWENLVHAIMFLKSFAQRLSVQKCSMRSTLGEKPIAQDLRASVERLIIIEIQREAFSREINCLLNGKELQKDSSIRSLNPFIDNDGIVRVGGRLNNADLSKMEKNPVLIPRRHHVATLLIRHYHDKVRHQGRLLTEGAIRNAGFWIVGCRRMINSYLRKCVRCLKLRGKQHFPKMADLPCDRLDPAPPFSFIGIDVFGPWTVLSRKTRGGQAHSKRWAVIFTCLVIRAIHIEVIQEMTSSSFINALRRFISLRGEFKLIRSDCGTNFVGAAKDIGANIIDIEEPNLKAFLAQKGISWRFNPPHSSHMGGVWERLIGISRRILDSLLLDVPHKNLTHEVLSTFMAEVCSIINARPLTGVPSDPESPMPLTPSTLLTLKTNHTVESFCIEEFSPMDLYKSQWRCVQQLANCFWKRWKNEFLSSLQARRKWQSESKNVTEGDVVLVRDKTLHRNEWPMAVISKAIPSEDGRVRKVEVRVGRDKFYLRPVTEVVVLVPKGLE